MTSIDSSAAANSSSLAYIYTSLLRQFDSSSGQQDSVQDTVSLSYHVVGAAQGTSNISLEVDGSASDSGISLEPAIVLNGQKYNLLDTNYANRDTQATYGVEMSDALGYSVNDYSSSFTNAVANIHAGNSYYSSAAVMNSYHFAINVDANGKPIDLSIPGPNGTSLEKPAYKIIIDMQASSSMTDEYTGPATQTAANTPAADFTLAQKTDLNILQNLSKLTPASVSADYKNYVNKKDPLQDQTDPSFLA